VSDEPRATEDASKSTSSPGASRRVVVLGGTGLVGGAAARTFLDEGWSVTVLARHEPDARVADALKGATVLVGDALSTTILHDALADADHVVDALGVPHPAASASAPVAQSDAELPSLLGVLDELRQRPGASLTYFSSGGAIYGNAEHLPVVEDTPCSPVSPYGATKLVAERHVLEASRRDGVPVRILRVGNAYGPMQRPRTGQGLVAALLNGAAAGVPVDLYGDGSTLRDYVDVRDVAAATVALATHEATELVVNVGTGIGHRVDDVLALAELVTGAKIEVRHFEARPTDVRAVVLDVQRLSTLMTWRPRTLEAGVHDVWEQWTSWRRDDRVVSAEVP
jgi:UDP-glucose 4-epimerase